MQGKFPQQSYSQVIGREATRAFEHQIPRRWNSIPSGSGDFGWDFLITIPSVPEEVGDDFFVQVKGSEEVHYLNTSPELSQQLRVQTIEWLLSKPMPSMLVVCDVAQPEQPIYWVWISDAVEALTQQNPSWRKQESITLRVPLANRLGPEAYERIEQDVKYWHQTQRISRMTFKLLNPEDLSSIPLDPGSAEEYLRQQVIPLFQQKGLIALVETDASSQIETYTPEDREKFKRLQDVSVLLRSFRDAEARQILDTETPNIDRAASSIQAMYFNSRGVLALREGKEPDAIAMFRQATKLYPSEIKYQVNLLAVEHKQSLKVSCDGASLPADWGKRLNDALSRDPDFILAIQLRAARIAEMENLEVAEAYLRGTSLWERDIVQALATLAELYKEAGQLPHAVKLLEEAERAEAGKLDAFFYSIKGLVLFLQAIGGNGTQYEFVLHGLGPASLDVGKLQQSAKAFQQASRLFAQQGYPLIAEPTILNAVIVFILLDRLGEAERLARSFLEIHPQSGPLHGALAMAFVHKGDPVLAIPHARQEFETAPTSQHAYTNYLLALLLAGDYDALLNAARERQVKGFSNSVEERTTRVFAAQAYAELGEFAHAETQIQSLRDDPQSYGDSVLIEALTEQRRGRPKDQIVGLLHQRLSTAPTDVKILSALFHHLLPLTKENTQETIETLNKIAELRQLSPNEIRALGQAYLLQEAIDDAERVFRSGRKRYPEDSRFVFEHAHTLFLRGDGEGAYEAMREYARLAERDDATYSNIGTLAESTGRLDEAITMFQTAISREKDPAQLGRLHCALFHLRRRREDDPKEVLRHAILFGKTIEGDVEKEALFLTMSLMTPLSEEDMKDPEVISWKGEIQSRLAAFSQEHPNFEGLRSFQIPQELPPEEQGAHLLSTLAALTLPSQLRSERAELAARGAAWPLATRAAFMDGVKSVFEYWRRCTVSRDFSHSIHIWEPSLNFAEEVKRIDFSRSVCIDLTALLTLNALDLLERVTDSFPEFVLSRGTLRAIQKERYSLFLPHPLAIRLDEWVTANRRKIRTLPVLSVSDVSSLDESRYRWEGGLWAPRRRTVAELVGDGVGESLLLAAQKNFLFYCDDLTIRKWARDEFHVGAFSTLSLLARLREEQILSTAHEARCLAKLISLHYRVVPFDVSHLHESLFSMLEQRERRTPPDTSDLHADKTLGVLLRQFGERELTDGSLIGVVNQWWLKLLQTSQVPEQTTLSLVSTLTYTLSMRSLENVLTGVSTENPQQRIAVIWGFFLVEVYLKEKELLGKAWSLLKSVAQERFRNDEATFNNILFCLVPEALYLAIQKHPALKGNEKTIALVSIPQEFGEEDRWLFEERLSKKLPG